MNAYDALPYPGYPYRQTHPDRLYTVARLFGLEPAHPERCRVLELGCGDGGNLIPMALEFPKSSFLGIDLAQTHIEKGQGVVRELGLANINLRQLDLTQAGGELGTFDYVIVYGLYSWAPQPVREQALALTQACLAQGGVAYVNYNANPGARLRQMLREMMLYETRDVADPIARTEHARSSLRRIVDSPLLLDEYGAFLKTEARRLLDRQTPFLRHDELGEVYEPFYFHEFIARARAHGLDYVAEATLSDVHTAAPGFDDSGEDIVAREQRLDFLKCRAFRHTLLCHSGIRLDHTVRTEAVARLFAASSAAVSQSSGGTEFRTSRGGLRTSHPVAVEALTHLAKSWPRAVPVSDLVQRAGKQHASAVCQILLNAFVGQVVELYSVPPKVGSVAGTRPCVSKLARLQAHQGAVITTLLHTYINVPDEIARRLIALLDGTRDRAALLAEMAAINPSMPRDAVAQQIESSLASLVRFGLML